MTKVKLRCVFVTLVEQTETVFKQVSQNAHITVSSTSYSRHWLNKFCRMLIKQRLKAEYCLYFINNIT